MGIKIPKDFDKYCSEYAALSSSEYHGKKVRVYHFSSYVAEGVLENVSEKGFTLRNKQNLVYFINPNKGLEFVIDKKARPKK